MSGKKDLASEPVSEVERCRQVRRAIDEEFGSLDKLFEHYYALDQERIRKEKAKAAAKRKAASNLTNDDTKKLVKDKR